MKKLLIVGIDPGTTIGYAVLNIKGNLIKKGSSKTFTLSSLIDNIHKEGKIAFVACDKRKVPAFVEKFARNLGAKLIHPYYDMLTEEKKKLVGDTKTKNSHEFDALASAKYAYKYSRSTIDKIDQQLSKIDKEHLVDEVTYLLITQKNMNLKKAIRMAEEEPQEEIKKVIKKKTPSKKTPSDKMLEKQKKEMALIKDYVKKLEKEKKTLISNNLKLKKKLEATATAKEARKALQQKNSKIKILQNQMRKVQTDVQQLSKEKIQIYSFIASIPGNYVLKKLKNLGLEEYMSKKLFLRLKKGDYLLVEDPNIISPKAMSEITKKVSIIFTKKKISPKNQVEGVAFIRAQPDKYQQNEFFALMPQKEFEQLLKKDDLIDKIVQDYRRARGG